MKVDYSVSMLTKLKNPYEIDPFPSKYSVDGKTFNAVEIEINSRCNRSCSYCPNSVGERIEDGEMDPKTYESIMLQLKEIEFKGRISYEFYNEPMLCSHFFEFVEMTKTILPKVTIELYTNGTLLTFVKFKRLYDLGVDKFIVTKHEGINRYCFDNTFERLSELEKARVVYRSYQDFKMSNRGGLVDAGPKVSTHLLPCYIPEQLLTITVNGNVIPCFEDFYQKNVMGNVNESTLIDIWNSEKYVRFRYELRKALRHKHDPCKNCNRLEVLPDNPDVLRSLLNKKGS